MPPFLNSTQSSDLSAPSWLKANALSSEREMYILRLSHINNRRVFFYQVLDEAFHYFGSCFAEFGFDNNMLADTLYKRIGLEG